MPITRSRKTARAKTISLKNCIKRAWKQGFILDSENYPFTRLENIIQYDNERQMLSPCITPVNPQHLGQKKIIMCQKHNDTQRELQIFLTGTLFSKIKSQNNMQLHPNIKYLRA